MVMDDSFSPPVRHARQRLYRRTVARNLLLKCYLETSAEAALTRLMPA